jgi:hypothetical protein
MKKETVNMANKQTADGALRNYLRPDEKVCWQGKTEKFSLLENDAKLLVLTKWIGTVVVAGAILIPYISSNSQWSVKFVGLVLLIGAMMVVSPAVERSSLLRQQYWITNQRAILMTRDRTLYSMELSDIDDIKVIHGQTPQDSLLLGGCLFGENERQVRWRACHPKTGAQSDTAEDVTVGLVFYNVLNSQGAAAHLRQRGGAHIG